MRQCSCGFSGDLGTTPDMDDLSAGMPKVQKKAAQKARPERVRKGTVSGVFALEDRVGRHRIALVERREAIELALCRRRVDAFAQHSA
jgi:hypothetical protein